MTDIRVAKESFKAFESFEIRNMCHRVAKPTAERTRAMKILLWPSKGQNSSVISFSVLHGNHLSRINILDSVCPGHSFHCITINSIGYFDGIVFDR